MNEDILKFENLCFSYPDGTRALKNLNFTIKKGERIAFIGSNGAGKSTLFLHLNGILRPSTGNLEAFGEDVIYKKECLMNLRKRVGIIFQNPDDQLFSPTVIEDVAFGPINLGLNDEEVEKRVSESLKRVGMEKLAHKAPHHLSSGQKKRVAIAGILAMEPEIIVFDEPTAYLDPLSAFSVLKIINGLNRDNGVTTITSSHEVDYVPLFATKIFVLHDGEIIGAGTPQEIFSNPELIEKAHLRIPQVADLMHSLRRAGVDVDVKLTVKEARDELLRLLE